MSKKRKLVIDGQEVYCGAQGPGTFIHCIKKLFKWKYAPLPPTTVQAQDYLTYCYALKEKGWSGGVGNKVVEG